MNKNESAFPVKTQIIEGGEVLTVLEGGLTKREYFTAMAMQGMITSNTVNFFNLPSSAVKMADDVLDELEKTNER